MKNCLTLFVLSLIWCHAYAYQQHNALTGHVYSIAGAPVAGATVITIPSGQKAASDHSGRFELPWDSTDTLLSVSSVGFKTAYHAIKGGADNIIVRLFADNHTLEEVIVETGYQRIPK